jgi:hypothetical protein
MNPEDIVTNAFFVVLLLSFVAAFLAGALREPAVWFSLAGLAFFYWLYKNSKSKGWK